MIRLIVVGHVEGMRIQHASYMPLCDHGPVCVSNNISPFYQPHPAGHAGLVTVLLPFYGAGVCFSVR